MPTRLCDLFIVEDDQLLASALSAQVETLGYTVVGLADTAEEAIAGVLRVDPDIVIMDVNLGAGGSGLEAARALRQQNKVPIIFYTSYSDAAFRRQVAKLENALVLQKPVPEEALTRALSAASVMRRETSERRLVPVR